MWLGPASHSASSAVGESPWSSSPLWSGSGTTALSQALREGIIHLPQLVRRSLHVVLDPANLRPAVRDEQITCPGIAVKRHTGTAAVRYCQVFHAPDERQVDVTVDCKSGAERTERVLERRVV